MSTAAIVASLVLVAVNGFFVAIEFALVASQRPKLELLAAEGNRRAEVALAAMRDLPRQLAGSQLGITMASLVLGVLGEPAVARLVEPVIEAFGEPPDGLVRTVSLIVALAIVTSFHMVLGEMVPKGLALAGPERAALALAGVNRVFVGVFRPVVRLLELLASRIVRIFGMQPAREIATALTAAELATLFDTSREEGVLEEFEHALLSGALDFRARLTSSVMVPAAEVVFVDRRMTVAAIEGLAHRSGHSRLPVVGTGIDNAIGFLHVKDLLRLPPDARNDPLPLELVRRMLVIPHDRPLEDVLRAMRRTRSHLALVQGDKGGTLGIVTLEDVLEELVGDMRDESDREGGNG